MKKILVFAFCIVILLISGCNANKTKKLKINYYILKIVVLLRY